MKTLKTYENFKEDNDVFLIAESIDYKLYESSDSSMWSSLIDKVKKDTGIQFGYITSFGVAVSALMPIISNLLQNGNIQITPESVVLLVIAALGILFNENSDDVQRLKLKIKEQGLSVQLSTVIKIIKSLKDIFAHIAKNSGKVINFVADMIAYTALLLPFLNVINFITTQNNMTIQDFLTMGASLALGSITLVVKNFVIDLWNRLKFKINSVSKLQNKDNISDINKSTELQGPKL